ncbi:MAG: carbohydrate ABC transporter permease [Pseudobutyrivibrio sp.]|nr:carbohydrate ABC transporter permease [Pseudobutyrivibrio sp.]
MNYKKKTPGEHIYIFVCYAIIILMCVLTLFPFFYLVAASFSGATAVMRNEVVLWPVDFTTKAYTVVMKYKGIWMAYANTIFYTVAGTTLSVLMTILAAYPLSKSRWAWKKPMGLFIVFTMWFSGGMIPFYLNMKNLHLLNTRSGILLYGAISAFYVIIFRTHFESIPVALEESAKLEGANDFQILFKIMVPLSKPIIAAIALYYAIDKWNAYFWEMLLLSDENLIPVQVLLQRIVINSQLGQDIAKSLSPGEATIPNTIKYAAIMITTMPIIVIYPFFQKYFVSGALVGSVKE